MPVTLNCQQLFSRDASPMEHSERVQRAIAITDLFKESQIRQEKGAATCEDIAGVVKQLCAMQPAEAYVSFTRLARGASDADLLEFLVEMDPKRLKSILCFEITMHQKVAEKASTLLKAMGKAEKEAKIYSAEKALESIAEEVMLFLSAVESIYDQEVCEWTRDWIQNLKDIVREKSFHTIAIALKKIEVDNHKSWQKRLDDCRTEADRKAIISRMEKIQQHSRDVSTGSVTPVFNQEWLQRYKQVLENPSKDRFRQITNEIVKIISDIVEVRQRQLGLFSCNEGKLHLCVRRELQQHRQTQAASLKANQELKQKRANLVPEPLMHYRTLVTTTQESLGQLQRMEQDLRLHINRLRLENELGRFGIDLLLWSRRQPNLPKKVVESIDIAKLNPLFDDLDQIVTLKQEVQSLLKELLSLEHPVQDLLKEKRKLGESSTSSTDEAPLSAADEAVEVALKLTEIGIVPPDLPDEPFHFKDRNFQNFYGAGVRLEHLENLKTPDDFKTYYKKTIAK